MNSSKVVGMVGLGKLGLPCLLAMEKHGGYSIKGFDTSFDVLESIRNKSVDYWEQDVNEYLGTTDIDLVNSACELVNSCDIIFIAVPTPHEKDFEGLTPLPNERKDFNYDFLRSATQDIATGLQKYPNKNPLIVVISTVLPGTMQSVVFPILSEARPDFRFVYNPYFIAMGTTISDFLNPEFILLGLNNLENLEPIKEFYGFLDTEFMQMAIESAELTKVAYNTFIGFKIVFANALAEITAVRGGNVDEVTYALGKATNRLMSEKYLSAGMADGGGCHPRDQIAMSWLAKEVDMSSDIFEFIAKSRDLQTERQAKFLIQESNRTGLSIVLLGKAYKSNSPLLNGSPALLLGHFLSAKGHSYEAVDPWVDNVALVFDSPRVFFISTKHDLFQDFMPPKGSLVIDPWGFFKSQNEITVIYPGRNISL